MSYSILLDQKLKSKTIRSQNIDFNDLDSLMFRLHNDKLPRKVKKDLKKWEDAWIKFIS